MRWDDLIYYKDVDVISIAVNDDDAGGYNKVDDERLKKKKHEWHFKPIIQPISIHSAAV